jgi:hypothetical protein
MSRNRIIEIDGEYIWEFPDLPDTEREYLRLLQLGPWSEADAKRLAELQPLDDAHEARWEAVLAKQIKDPGSVPAGAVMDAEERDSSWGCEWLALDSKWRRKTAEGREAAAQEWETLRRTNFRLPRAEG